MVSPQPASEIFGQMKKHNSSSSRNEEWPGARKHRNWLRWSAALTLGLAVAAGVSIPLEEKSNQSSDDKASIATTADGNTMGEELLLENYTPSPTPQTRFTTTSSGEIQRKWDIETNIPNQEPAVESSTVLTESQGAARRENATPAQGSDSSSVGYGTIRTSPPQAMLERPQAPAVGRIPPVRPLPTPRPTPPPIRSPQ
jgi:hypothetical protein